MYLTASEEEQDDENAFAVWPENWPVVEAFLHCSTQWRVGGMGGVLGLDYVAVKVVLEAHEVENWKEIFIGIQVMERAAIPMLNKKAD